MMVFPVCGKGGGKHTHENVASSMHRYLTTTHQQSVYIAYEISPLLGQCFTQHTVCHVQQRQKAFHLTSCRMDYTLHSKWGMAINGTPLRAQESGEIKRIGLRDQHRRLCNDHVRRTPPNLRCASAPSHIRLRLRLLAPARWPPPDYHPYYHPSIS